MTSAPPEASPRAEGPPSNVRSIVSLLLFIHCFCLFAALTANYVTSPLQASLLSAPIVAQYVNFFRLRPAAPVHLASDVTELSDDYIVEAEVTAGAQSGQVIRLPQSRVGASPSARRFQTLARTIGVTMFFGEEGDSAIFSKAIGARILSEGPNDEVVVRCMRYQPQPRLLDATNPTTPANPAAREYLTPVYQARVWRDRLGQVQLLKVEEKKVVAPLE